MNKILCLGFILSLGVAGAARATIVTSNSFTMGYGVTANGSPAVQWTDSETSGSNTNVTGPFSLSVVFSSRTPSADTADPTYDGAGSFQGPTFPNRVLSNGSLSDVSGWAPRFEVTVTGSYTDAAPPGS